jgi:hypothetical protein
MPRKEKSNRTCYLGGSSEVCSMMSPTASVTARLHRVLSPVNCQGLTGCRTTALLEVAPRIVCRMREDVVRRDQCRRSELRRSNELILPDKSCNTCDEHRREEPARHDVKPQVPAQKRSERGSKAHSEHVEHRWAFLGIG